jgi:hypothetical protein
MNAGRRIEKIGEHQALATMTPGDFAAYFARSSGCHVKIIAAVSLDSTSSATD